MITETPDKWSNPLGNWFDHLFDGGPLIHEINCPRVTKTIKIVDRNETYHLTHMPNGERRFIEESKLQNAETLGLSVRRA